MVMSILINCNISIHNITFGIHYVILLSRINSLISMIASRIHIEVIILFSIKIYSSVLKYHSRYIFLSLIKSYLKL